MTAQSPGLVESLTSIDGRLNDLNLAVNELGDLIVLNKKTGKTDRRHAMWIATAMFVMVFISIGTVKKSADDLNVGRAARVESIYQSCLSINDSNSVIRDLVTAALSPAKQPEGLTPAALQSWEATQQASRDRATKFAALVRTRTVVRTCTR